MSNREQPIRVIVGLGTLLEWPEDGGDHKEIQIEILECGHWFDKRILKAPNLSQKNILLGSNGRRCPRCPKEIY